MAQSLEQLLTTIGDTASEHAEAARRVYRKIEDAERAGREDAKAFYCFEHSLCRQIADHLAEAKIAVMKAITAAKRSEL